MRGQALLLPGRRGTPRRGGGAPRGCWRRPDDLVGLLAVVTVALVERQLARRRVRSASPAAARGSPSRRVEEGLEDLVEPRQVVGARAQGGATGDADGRRVVDPEQGRSAARKSWARSWVTGTPPARSARANAEQDLVAAADRRVVAQRRLVGRLMARSSWSSACFTRSESSRYFTSAPSVLAADSRSSSAVPRWCRARAQSMVSATPGRLLQVAAAQLLDDPDDLAGERLGDLGRPGAHDLQLALEAGVLDPVVEAAALERVVQLAGAVGGQDDDRRRRGLRPCRARGCVTCQVDSTSSRNASNSSSARSTSSTSSSAGLCWSAASTGRASRNRSSYRLFSASSTSAPARRPRARAGAGSGAGSPSRRGPGWRRCPRSTAAGPAAGSRLSASASASAVLPVPGSPSSSSGRCIASAR